MIMWMIRGLNSTTTSLPSIVVSSLFTLLISTWCCVRPDVPSPHDSKIRILSTRLNLFFWMLICPEAILFWSIRQWVEAGKVAKTYRNRGWTRRQALFLLMGGFVLCKDGQPLQTLSAQHLTRLLDQGAIDFPSVTIADIQERSNFHPIFALLGFLQTSWFIIQSLTRLINNGITITPLEFMTFITVCVNMITLIFAWQKPLDPRYPILVHHKSNIREPNEPEDSFVNVGGAFRREQESSRTLEQIFRLEEPQPYRQYSIPLPRIQRRCLKFMLSWPFRSVYRDAIQLVMTTNASEQPPGTLGHPLFYISDSIDLRPFLFLITMLAAGTNMATLEVLGRGSFPSESAWSFWEINATASMMFMTFLFLLFAQANLIRLFCRSRYDRGAETICNIAILFFLPTLLPFIIFRLLLFLVSLLCLKGLPQKSLTVIPWTNYIPHFS